MPSTYSSSTFDSISTAAQAIREKFALSDDNRPAVAIVLGSGLGNFSQTLRGMLDFKSMPYTKIPNFPQSTVEGHDGNLLFARTAQHSIFAMQGRFHCYEGYTPQQVVLPLRVLIALGVKTIILTNAAGGIADDCGPGDLMLIEDHINLTGNSPLMGSNDSRIGPRFVDMTETYDANLRKIAKKVAGEIGLDLKTGVYLGLLGPTYETPAEVRMLAGLGANAVGMSTVFEAIAARHAGIRVLGISCITNKAAGLSKGNLNHEDVKHTAEKSSAKFSELITGILESI